jgi:hypothetical protein
MLEKELLALAAMNVNQRSKLSGSCINPRANNGNAVLTTTNKRSWDGFFEAVFLLFSLLCACHSVAHVSSGFQKQRETSRATFRLFIFEPFERYCFSD